MEKMPGWKNGCKSGQTSWGITASPNNGIQKKRPRRVGDSNVAGPLCCSLVEREDLALACAAEQLDLLLALVDDGLRAGSQQLAGVEALALLILASLDVLAGQKIYYQMEIDEFIK